MLLMPLKRYAMARRIAYNTIYLMPEASYATRPQHRRRASRQGISHHRHRDEI